MLLLSLCVNSHSFYDRRVCTVLGTFDPLHAHVRSFSFLLILCFVLHTDLTLIIGVMNAKNEVNKRYKQ